MSIKQADLEARVLDMFTSDLSSSVLRASTEAAVMYYSRFNPCVVRDTLQLATDETVYDLPSNFLLLDWFDWWPEGEASVTGMSTNALWDTVYKAALSDMKAARLSPSVRVHNKQLVLDVQPESADEVDYSYFAFHEANSGEYPTIPAEDLQLLAKLTAAEVLDILGTEAGLDPDITEGLLSIAYRTVPMNISLVKQDLRKEVKAKYGGY